MRLFAGLEAVDLDVGGKVAKRAHDLRHIEFHRQCTCGTVDREP